MKLFWLVCGALMLTCCGESEGGVMRNLQHEIDVINIALNNDDLTIVQKSFLIGKSEGLFLAIEILSQQGTW